MAKKPRPAARPGQKPDVREPQAARGARPDDIVMARSPREDYQFSVAQDDGGCALQHTFSSHLTYHRADGTIDQAESSSPMPPVDAARHPRINFKYQGRITDPINAQTPHVSDCVMVAFYDSPHGTGRWNGRIQVICRKVYDAPTSVWLDYNGQRAPGPHVNGLEGGADARKRCLFTRGLESFRRVHQDIGMEYRESLHVSVNGCTVTIIGEASVRGADGRMVRTTKIHTINCCHDEGETL